MSSAQSPQHLTADNLTMLSGILRDAGFNMMAPDAGESLLTEAASMLIRKFQEGSILREELLVELEAHFASYRNAAVPSVHPGSRYAIQGLLVHGR